MLCSPVSWNSRLFCLSLLRVAWKFIVVFIKTPQINFILFIIIILVTIESVPQHSKQELFSLLPPGHGFQGSGSDHPSWGSTHISQWSLSPAWRFITFTRSASHRHGGARLGFLLLLRRPEVSFYGIFPAKGQRKGTTGQQHFSGSGW